MSYSIASRHSSPYVPLRKAAKSPLSESHASSYLNAGRGVAAAPARRTNPATTSRISSTTSGSLKIGSSRPPVSNKWFQDPKIPVRLNSSTLIRMKSKNPSTDKGIGDNKTNNQLTVAALSFLKRDRRMSDFEVAKGISPFGDNSYVKSVFLSIVSHYDHQAVVQASANSFGDGMHTDATYHRIAAISLNNDKSGCNLKFVEHVSYKGITPSGRNLDTDSVGQSHPVVSASKSECNSFGVCNLNAMLKQVTLSKPKKAPNVDDKSDDDVLSEDEESVEVRPQVIRKKRKLGRKHKKAALVTSMRNSSLKLMSKNTTRGTGT